MFELIAALVIRRGWVVVLGWMTFLVVLRALAPPWDRVSKDDDVRFFPPGYPSVVGPDLLERGFPNDASSSQVVVISERREGQLGKVDYAFVDQLIATFNRARESD